MNLLAIITDLDGTIIDSVPHWNNLDITLLKQFNKNPQEDIFKIRSYILDKYKHLNKGKWEKWAQYLQMAYNLPCTPEEIEKRRKELGTDLMKNVIDLRPGAAEFLKEMNNKGIKLALATASSRFSYEIYANENKKIRKKLLFDEIFEFVITSDEVSKSKPHPEMYRKASEFFRENYNIKRKNLLVLEDSLSGVTAAKKANIPCAALREESSVQDIKQIKQKTKIYVNNYQELYKKLT